MTPAEPEGRTSIDPASAPTTLGPTPSHGGAGLESAADAATIEEEIVETKRRMFSWRRLSIQAFGFILGAGLIAWLLWYAARDPTVWERLRHADPRLVAALLACSAASLVLNGLIFWISVQPIRKLGAGELQWVNVLAALMNYAPVRLGIFVRLAWHLRVDRMRLREIAAWFGSVTYSILVPLGAAIVASLATGGIGWPFLGLAVVLIVIGGVAAPAVARRPFVSNRCGGLERVVTDPRALWGAMGLRSLELCLWAMRMLLTVRILGMDLSPAQSVMLALAGLAVTLNPLGRLGFREATVAFVAARMVGGDSEDLLVRSSQLAVLESAGEFAVTLPAGLLAIFMLAKRWRQTTRTRSPARAA